MLFHLKSQGLLMALRTYCSSNYSVSAYYVPGAEPDPLYAHPASSYELRGRDADPHHADEMIKAYPTEYIRQGQRSRTWQHLNLELFGAKRPRHVSTKFEG